MKEGSTRIVIEFWDAVTLGFGFGVGLLIAYGLIGVAIVIVISIRGMPGS